MLVTTCWWLYVGHFMLGSIFGCWWPNFDIDAIFWILMTDTVSAILMLEETPTLTVSSVRYQHRCRRHVTDNMRKMSLKVEKVASVDLPWPVLKWAMQNSFSKIFFYNYWLGSKLFVFKCDMFVTWKQVI